jgi:hypothetical protein
VDHVARGQPPGGRCLGVTRGAAAEQAAFRNDFRSARAVDRAIDSATAE